eukprot:1798891-Rhodomonas_salina.2
MGQRGFNGQQHPPLLSPSPRPPSWLPPPASPPAPARSPHSVSTQLIPPQIELARRNQKQSLALRVETRFRRAAREGTWRRENQAAMAGRLERPERWAAGRER